MHVATGIKLIFKFFNLFIKHISVHKLIFNIQYIYGKSRAGNTGGWH
jgi:hypothetical protein